MDARAASSQWCASAEDYNAVVTESSIGKTIGNGPFYPLSSGLDLIELFFNDPVSPLRFLVQVAEFAKRLHPGLVVSSALVGSLSARASETST